MVLWKHFSEKIHLCVEEIVNNLTGIYNMKTCILLYFNTINMLPDNLHRATKKPHYWVCQQNGCEVNFLHI